MRMTIHARWLAIRRGHALPASCLEQADARSGRSQRHAPRRPARRTISRYIFGQFAEHLGFGIYGGIWVGEDSKIPNTNGYRNDVVAALKRLEVPVVRWPGGCFADEYHWREGVGPRDKRPVRVNTHWGGVEETNAFGTHEFMNFAELIGADAYVSGNVGDGTPEEMAQWVEYITSDTKSTLANERRANGRDKPWKLPFFGVGNELWGCGGNMRAEYAADLYRRYQTFVKSPPGSEDPEDRRRREQSTTTTGPKCSCARRASSSAACRMHYYTSPGPNWPTKRSSTDFGEDQWIETLSKALYMEELITKHSAVMDKYDPDKKVGLMVDEWGTWYTGPAWREPRLPVSAEQPARCGGRGDQHQHLQPAHRSREDGEHRADGERAAGDDPDAGREDGAHAHVLRLRDVQAVQGRRRICRWRSPRPSIKFGEYKVPAVHASAARGKDGKVYVGLANLDPTNAAKLSVKIGRCPGREVLRGRY